MMAIAAVITADPHAKGGDNAYNVQVLQLYDALVDLSPEGKFVGNIAESWKYSEDGMSWTFNLRKGIKFHDGSELNAEDVKFSLERLLALGQGYYYLFKDYVDRVEAVDDHTVKFAMKKPYGPFRPPLSAALTICNKDLVMKHLATGKYGQFQDYGMEWLGYHDAGSGPYVLDELKPQEGMTVHKFNDYWKGWTKGSIDQAEIKLVTEASTTRSMMSNGQLDFSTCFQSTESLQALDKLNGVDIGVIQSGGTYYLQLNTKAAPLDDVHIRRALAHLIDHAMICKIVSGAGYKGTIASSATSGVTNNITQYEYGLDKAKAEIAQSKYASNIKNTPVELYWLDTAPDEEKVGLALQAAAQQVGITVKLTKTTWLNLTDKVGKPESTPAMCIVSFSSKTSELCSVLLVKYHSSSQGTWNNTSWYKDTDVDKLIEQAAVTMDEKPKEIKSLRTRRKKSRIWLLQQMLWEHPVQIAYNSARISWEIAERAAKGQPAYGYVGK